MSMLPHVNSFCKSAFIILAPFPTQGNTYPRKLLRFLFTPLGLQNSITAILYYILMSLKTSSKSFNGCRMQLPDWLHALGGVITSLPSSSVFTGYLFLNELNSRFYYLPSRLCISNLQPTFKTYWPATYRLDRFDHLLCSVWILLAVSAPNLENKLPDDTRSCEKLNIFKYKLKTYLFKNYYFIRQKDFFDFTCVIFKFKFSLINIYFNFIFSLFKRLDHYGISAIKMFFLLLLYCY